MTAPTPTRRLVPTPAWLIFGLLVVEGLLWLSERYTWFAFNQHKGWTVLIAVAAVGVAFLLMLLWFIASLLFRWRFQFSIRSLLVLTVAVAIPCSWLGVEMKEAKRQREAVAAIERLGGSVEWSRPFGPAWLRSSFGDGFYRHVISVTVSGSQVTDASLECISDLPQLRSLYICSQSFSFSGNSYRLREAEENSRTKVTNAGLKHLTGLSHLELLALIDTQVTDEGVKELQQALPNCKIEQ